MGRRKSGETFPAEISLGPIETEEGLIVCAAIRDITERKRAELQRRETEIELSMAQRIQGHLLPQASPDVSGFDIAGVSFPAEYAGGDHFDFLPLSNGSLGIVVGDVSGHGFASSLLMASTHSFIRARCANHIAFRQDFIFRESAIFVGLIQSFKTENHHIFSIKT